MISLLWRLAVVALIVVSFDLSYLYVVPYLSSLWPPCSKTVWGSDSSWFWTMVQAIGTILQATVVIGTLVFIFFQLRAQGRANMLQALGTLDDRWNSPPTLRARKGACASYTDPSLEIGHNQQIVLSFFEDIGLYLAKKVFDSEVVWSKWSQEIEYYWLMHEPHVSQFRQESGDSTWYDKFEFLYREMEKFAKKADVPFGNKSPKEINKYATWEVSSTEDG